MATMRDYERQVVDEEDACYVGKNEDNEGDMQPSTEHGMMTKRTSGNYT